MNFLFILADDLGWRDLGCYGRPDYATPVLDQLSTRARRFTQAYASASSCSPTRVALMTGRYPQRVPVGLIDPLPPGCQVGLPESCPTLPLLLREAGYRTGLVGKWHLGEGPGQGPLHHGYEEFFGFLGGAMTYFSHRSAPDAAPALREGDCAADASGYATDLFARRAADFIRHRDARPFFLSLHFNAPHWPWHGPGDEAAERELREMWHYEGGSPAAYARMVVAMDEAIGRVLLSLQDSGKAADTLVVFTSDNGGERYSYHWPLTGAKGGLWEGGIRVPLVVFGPGVDAGTCDLPCATIDWMPTILSLAGCGTASGLDGIDVSPALRGEALPERTLFWRTQDMGAARLGPWKYLRRGEERYLANLEMDVTENANFSRRRPDVFAALEARYRDWDASMLPLPAEARRESWDQIVLRRRRLETA